MKRKRRRKLRKSMRRRSQRLQHLHQKKLRNHPRPLLSLQSSQRPKKKSKRQRRHKMLQNLILKL